MSESRMFEFITKTWNPLGGRCEHDCWYCWARKLAKRFELAKYRGEVRLDEKAMRKRFGKSEFVFVCSMTDLFGNWVEETFQDQIFDVIRQSPEADFLLLTKNPEAYYWLARKGKIPENCVLGATIETNRLFSRASFAPLQPERIKWMLLTSILASAPKRRFVSVEPIMNFDREFAESLIAIEPWAVAVGYDNYDNRLCEPPLSKTLRLVSDLSNAGVKVYLKTLRECWVEP